ncbi:hypothetical protein ABBQ38_012636 [Trebouxia sp. C0009 RCD-2024]
MGQHLCYFTTSDNCESNVPKSSEAAALDALVVAACVQKAVQDGASLKEALTCQPTATDLELQRELASIHRSDLTLVCSPYELTLLRDVYSIPHNKLCSAPFFTSAQPHQQPFSSREHFMTIGTWKHPPNRDGVHWLCLHIWPAIRQQLPHAQLHIYGAHMSGAAQQYHKPAAGVHVKGFAPSLDIMQQYRVCLAPLRFGAGLKGKIVDSWAHGTPVCTTPMGAEGMFPATSHSPEGFPTAEAGCDATHGSNMGWGGLWTATDAEEFAANAVRMYTSEEEWHVWQQRGFELLHSLYNKADRLKTVQEAISTAVANQEQRRRQDFVGQMLWSQQLRATEYFSRWIELKEQNKRG